MTQGLSSNSKSQELYSKITLALEEFKAVKENGEPWGQVTNRDEMADALINAQNANGESITPKMAYNKKQLFVDIFSHTTGDENFAILSTSSVKHGNTSTAQWLADNAPETLLKGFVKMSAEQKDKILGREETAKNVSVFGTLIKVGKPEFFDLEYERNFVSDISAAKIESHLSKKDSDQRCPFNYAINKDEPEMLRKPTEKLDGEAMTRLLLLRGVDNKPAFQSVIDKQNPALTEAAVEKLSSEQMMHVVKECKDIMKFVDDDSLAVIGSKLGHADKVEFNSLMNEVKGTGQGQSQAR